METAGAALFQRRHGQVRFAGFLFFSGRGYGRSCDFFNASATWLSCEDAMKLTGAEILCESLTRLGVREIFGYPGGAILPVYDALGKSKLHHVLVRHEPGATNMVTGIATAMMDSSPVVCITGQVSSKVLGSDAFQEIDITGITMPITKHNVVVTKAEDIARTIREAFVIAKSGRPGPVLVDVTKDAQQATAEFDWETCAPKLPPKRVRNNHDPAEF